MLQDTARDWPFVDHREQPEPATAPWALQHVESKRPLHQLRLQSVRARPPCGLDRSRNCRRRLGRFADGCLENRPGRRRPGGASGLAGSGQSRSPGRMCRQYSVVQHQVEPRLRRQRCQPFQQLQGMKAQMCRPVTPAVMQLQQHVSPVRRIRSCAIGGRSAYRHTRSSCDRSPAGTRTPASRSNPPCMLRPHAAPD